MGTRETGIDARIKDENRPAMAGGEDVSWDYYLFLYLSAWYPGGCRFTCEYG